MTDKVRAVINNIVSKTTKTFAEVEVELGVLVEESKRGTHNVSDRALKLRESINAYIYLHKR
jgi:hypothetical protein